MMRRFRIRRRRALALALVPAAALTIGSTTLSAAAEPRQAAIDPAKSSVRFGERVTLRGEFPGAPGAPVAIEFRAAGRKAYRQVATTRTDEASRWTAKVKPRGSGLWRARLTGTPPRATDTGDPLEAPAPVDGQSDAKRVNVRSVTTASARNFAIAGRSLRVSGKVKPGGKRKAVVEVGGQSIRTRTNRRGEFSVKWHAGSAGTRTVTARAGANSVAKGSRDSAGKVTVYRHAQASWYGPGLYGNRTACGQTLTSSTIGVAHKTMPCGTKLKLRHGNNTVTARVIDRGPYVGDREFDLTEATRNKLGFGSTGTILVSK
jgi:rare lipoprotein A (peptidoglycan hydrolase)